MMGGNKVVLFFLPIFAAENGICTMRTKINPLTY